jgi:hypothetical protein
MKTPVRTIRIGQTKANIWRNRTKVGDRHVVPVARLLRNDEVGQESIRFGPDDLPLVNKVVYLARTWIYQVRDTEEKSND